MRIGHGSILFSGLAAAATLAARRVGNPTFTGSATPWVLSGSTYLAQREAVQIPRSPSMHKSALLLSLLVLPAAAVAGPPIAVTVKPDCANTSAPKIVGSTVRVTLSSLTLGYYVRQKGA
ncbi:MAG: hypothetical protein FJW31_01625 [Acidobacteria bacterium]|nr:hypothetical protein [Acidobacteriota bacterium]